MVRLIVAESEDATRRAVAASLRSAGFEVAEAADVSAFRALIAERLHPADGVVLGLADSDALDLARRLRERADVGLIVVSGRTEPEARIEALDQGADDVLVRPVHEGELAARIRSVLRRCGRRDRHVRIGRWEVDLDGREARDGDTLAALTRGEFEILARLVEARGRIVSRDELLRGVSRNPDESDIRSVDALVSRLRRKLGDSPDAPILILTAPGLGYRLGGRAGRSA